MVNHLLAVVAAKAGLPSINSEQLVTNIEQVSCRMYYPEISNWIASAIPFTFTRRTEGIRKPSSFSHKILADLRNKDGPAVAFTIQ